MRASRFCGVQSGMICLLLPQPLTQNTAEPGGKPQFLVGRFCADPLSSGNRNIFSGIKMPGSFNDSIGSSFAKTAQTETVRLRLATP